MKGNYFPNSLRDTSPSSEKKSPVYRHLYIETCVCVYIYKYIYILLLIWIMFISTTDSVVLFPFLFNKI